MARKTKSRLGCLLFVAVLAAAVWLGRETIAGWLGGFEIGLRSAPSERLAEQAEGKIERMFRLGLTEPVRFSEAELQSLLTYRALPSFPPGIEDPQVDVQDSVVVVSALLRPDDLESGPEAVMSLLADTSRVISAVTPSIRRPGLLAVTVETLQVGSFAVPSLMIPALMATLSERGLNISGAALVAPVPRDVGRVEIDGDDVILIPAEQP